MSVFKETLETKRVIFNVKLELAERLEKAKEEAKCFGKKLDVDSAIDKALEKFLKKVEKKMQELGKELRIYSKTYPDSTDALNDNSEGHFQSQFR